MIDLQPGVLYDVVIVRNITAYRDVVYYTQCGQRHEVRDMKGVGPGARGHLRLVDASDPEDRLLNWNYKVFLDYGWYAYLGSAGPMFQLISPLQLLAEAAD